MLKDSDINNSEHLTERSKPCTQVQTDEKMTSQQEVLLTPTETHTELQVSVDGNVKCKPTFSNEEDNRNMLKVSYIQIPCSKDTIWISCTVFVLFKSY